jgi:hypothetical protein
MTGRVGIDTFGFTSILEIKQNTLYSVDNCADAIVLAGINKEADGQIFNI